MPEPCPACGGELRERPAIVGSDRLHGLPGSFEVRTCESCGSGRTFPAVAPEDLAGLYPLAYNAYRLPSAAPARFAATQLFRWRYRLAMRRPPLSALNGASGRVLDVGGGRGDLGVTLGGGVLNLEPSPEACEAARERGVQSVCGTLTGPQRAELEGQFDAVVFQHSLEHVVDPLADLTAARRLTRPGGLLLVTLPNFGSWQARRFRADWFHLDLPRHRSHLTPPGLEALIRRAGFAEPALSTSTSADGLPTSLQFRRYGRRRFDQGVGLYLTFAATLAAVPLTRLADKLGGGGDFLHAVARAGDPA
jgi:SAM-dependent methyltransferase